MSKMGDLLSPLRLNETKTLEFIQLYKNEACLWNSFLDDYKVKNKRIAAVAKIAKQLNVPNFEAKHVMMKFKNLRNSYTQELKKIAQSQSTGDELLLYKPRVPWFKAMEFIKPHLQYRVVTGHPTLIVDRDEKKHRRELKHEDPPVASESVDDLTDLDSEGTFSQDLFQDLTYGNTEDMLDYPGEKRTQSQNELQDPLTKRKRSEIVVETIEGEPAQITTIRPVEKTQDVHDHFGAYIASLMRNLPMTKAVTLQPKIVEMIASAIEEDAEEIT